MPDKMISSGAQIAPGVELGFNVFVGPGVKIGAGTKIAHNVVIDGKTEIGKDCMIYSGAVIGSDPQDLKFKGEDTSVRIGDNCRIREYVTVNKGTLHKDEASGEMVMGETVIGSNCLLMANVHIAHDCIVGESVIMANVCTLGGHVTIEDHAVLSGLVPVHQFGKVGRFAMIGGGIRIPQDVPPFCLVGGPPPKLYGLNSVGLERHGFSREVIEELKMVYRVLFRSKKNISDALAELSGIKVISAEALHMIDFVRTSKRGICK